jgi:hypothetical protein
MQLFIEIFQIIYRMRLNGISCISYDLIVPVVERPLKSLVLSFQRALNMSLTNTKGVTRHEARSLSVRVVAAGQSVFHHLLCQAACPLTGPAAFTIA